MSKSSLLVLNKEEGVTSFTSLYPVKRYFKGEKVGHAGTLDKFAHGIMLVLTGKATRLNPMFSSLDKSYVAQVKFGVETDTLDPEGEVIKTGFIPTRESVEAVLPSFLGKQIQIPPVYSALHVEGKRAYQLARSGVEVEMKGRDITIYSIALLSMEGDIATISLRVSKGTYVRSFARDLGEKLGTCASLAGLERTSIGVYGYDDLSELESAVEKTPELLLKMDNIFKVEIKEEAVKKLLNGNFVENSLIGDTSKDGYYLGFYQGICLIIFQRENNVMSIFSQFGEL